MSYLSAMDLSASDEDMSCPLCLEEMDSTDRKFQPCHCGYQICLWCWHHIMEMAAKDSLEGRCPACRSPYDKEKIVSATPSDRDELPESGIEKKQKFGKGRSKATAGGTGGGGGGQGGGVSASTLAPDVRKHLANVRVVQRNLVYVVGMPYSLADEETLMRKEYFGQYGKVLKIAVSRSSSTMSGASSTIHGATANVYVTFVREEDAVRCIQATDGCMFEGRILRACFGTTKYCNAWLKNLVCPNPDCLYLHEVGTQEDSYTKEEMLHRYNTGLTSVSAALGSAAALVSKHHSPFEAGGVNRRAANGLPPPPDNYFLDKHAVPSFSSALGAGIGPIGAIGAIGAMGPIGAIGARAAAAQGAATLGKASAAAPAAGSAVGPASGGGILPAAASWGAKGSSGGRKLILSTSKPIGAPGNPPGLQNGHAAAPGANAFSNASAWPPPAVSSALYSSSPPTVPSGFGLGSTAAAAGLSRGLPYSQQHSALTSQQFKPSAAVLSGRVIHASAHSPPVIAGQTGTVHAAAFSGHNTAAAAVSGAGPGPSTSAAAPGGGKSPYRERQRKSPPSPMQSSPPPSSSATLASAAAPGAPEAASFAAAAAAGASSGSDGGASRLQPRAVHGWAAPPGVNATAASASASSSASDASDAGSSLGHIQRLSDVVSGSSGGSTREMSSGGTAATPAMPPGITSAGTSGPSSQSMGAKGGSQGGRGKSRLVVLGHTGGSSSKGLLGAGGLGATSTSLSSGEKGAMEKTVEARAESLAGPSSDAKDVSAVSAASTTSTDRSNANMTSTTGSNAATSASSKGIFASSDSNSTGTGSKGAESNSSAGVADASVGAQENAKDGATSTNLSPALLAVPPGFGPTVNKTKGSEDVGSSKGKPLNQGLKAEVPGSAGLLASTLEGTGTFASTGSAPSSSGLGNELRMDSQTLEAVLAASAQPAVLGVDWSMSRGQEPGRFRDPSLVDWQTNSASSSPQVPQDWGHTGGQLSASADSVLFPKEPADSILFPKVPVSLGGSITGGILGSNSSLMARMSEVAQQLQQTQREHQQLHPQPQQVEGVALGGSLKEHEWKLIEGILEMPLKNGKSGTAAHGLRNGDAGEQEEEVESPWDASWLAAAAISSSLKAQSSAHSGFGFEGGQPSAAAAAAAALVASASASPKDPVAGWLLHSLSLPAGPKNGTHSALSSKTGLAVSAVPTAAAAAAAALITPTSRVSGPALGAKQSRFSFARSSSAILEQPARSSTGASAGVGSGASAGAGSGPSAAALVSSMSFPQDRAQGAGEGQSAAEPMKPVPEAPPGFGGKRGNASEGSGSAARKDVQKPPGFDAAPLSAPPGFKLPARMSPPGNALAAASVPALDGANQGYSIQAAAPVSTLEGAHQGYQYGRSSGSSLLNAILDSVAGGAATSAAEVAAPSDNLPDGIVAHPPMWQNPSSNSGYPPSANSGSSSFLGGSALLGVGSPLSADFAPGLASAFTPGSGAFSTTDWDSSISGTESGWAASRSVLGVPRADVGTVFQAPDTGFGAALSTLSGPESIGGGSGGRFFSGSTAASASAGLMSALSLTMQGFSTGSSNASPGPVLASSSMGFPTASAIHPSSTSATPEPASVLGAESWAPLSALGNGATPGPQSGSPMQDPGTSVHGQAIGHQGANVATGGQGDAAVGTAGVSTPDELEPWQLLPETGVGGEGAQASSSLAGLVGLGASVLLGKTSSSGMGLASAEGNVESSILLKASSRRTRGGRFGFGLEDEGGK